MNDNDLALRVNRVALLSDGLFIVASVNKEHLEIVLGDKDIGVHAEATPGEVSLSVGKLVIPLPSPVFEHLVEKKSFFVYLSDYESYVMAPWVSGEIVPADLWEKKGVAGYLQSI
jgi:hypothetical protein